MLSWDRVPVGHLVPVPQPSLVSQIMHHIPGVWGCRPVLVKRPFSLFGPPVLVLSSHYIAAKEQFPLLLSGTAKPLFPLIGGALDPFNTPQVPVLASCIGVFLPILTHPRRPDSVADMLLRNSSVVHQCIICSPAQQRLISYCTTFSYRATSYISGPILFAIRGLRLWARGKGDISQLDLANATRFFCPNK